MGKKEKQNSLSTVKRGSSGDVRLERNSLTDERPAKPSEALVMSGTMLSIIAGIAGSVAMQQQWSGSMSLAHVTTKGHSVILGLATWMSKSCAELAWPLTWPGQHRV